MLERPWAKAEKHEDLKDKEIFSISTSGEGEVNFRLTRHTLRKGGRSMNVEEIFELVFVLLFAMFAGAVPTSAACVRLVCNRLDGEAPEWSGTNPDGGGSFRTGAGYAGGD